jgi:hypothetical protein
MCNSGSWARGVTPVEDNEISKRYSKRYQKNVLPPDKHNKPNKFYVENVDSMGIVSKKQTKTSFCMNTTAWGYSDDSNDIGGVSITIL